MKRVQKRENIRADRNLRKFLTKLFHLTNEKSESLKGVNDVSKFSSFGCKAKMKCRVENHSAGWNENG